MMIDLTRQLAIRWPDPDAAHLPLLQSAGIEAVVLDSPHAGFEAAARAAGVDVAMESAVSAAAAVVPRGLWPGIRSEPKRAGGGDETASASREPWIDANGYLVAVERALQRGGSSRTPVLGYRADAKAGLTPDRSVPFATLEIALVEARVYGGNYLMSMDPRYRAALLQGDAKAKAAWASLGATAAWLKANAGMLGRPTLPIITALVEPGYATTELANLLHRRNGAPAIASASAVPPPAPDRIIALVAASLKTVPEAVWAHARAGSIVVIDSPPQPGWKLAKQEPDRSFFELGRGQIVAYNKRIADPSEFALDVIDLVNQKRRAVRTWNALSTIAHATTAPGGGGALLHVINYGSPVTDEVQARVQGRFAQATLLRPGAARVDLKVYSRGTQTEVFLPRLTQVAMVHFR